MKTAVFQTEQFGRIEVDERVAYFARDDYEAPVVDGEFESLFGHRFQILWPFRAGQDAILQAMEWRTLGRVAPTIKQPVEV